nr:ATP synthase F1 subunit delta [Ardenticatena sp.]
MSAQKTAKIYAQAILQTALEDWLTGIQKVRRLLEENPELLTELEDAGKPPAEREKRLAGVLPKDLKPEVANFVRLLVRNNDLNLLDAIVATLDEILEQTGAHVRTAEITTAVELSPEEKAKLEEKLTAQYGEGLIFEYKVDPAVLGGVRVRIGDHLIDATVAGRLNALRERLVG